MMNHATASSEPGPKRRRVWPWILGCFAACLVLLGAGVYSAITLDRDAAALRRDVITASGIKATTKVQGTIGPVILGSARALLHVIPTVPAEAHEVLAVIRSASVGVYELGKNPDAAERRAMLAAIDATMEHRGWTRLVVINESRQTIAIYAPANARSDAEFPLCFAVCDGRKLVVATTRANAVALSRLVQRKISRAKA